MVLRKRGKTYHLDIMIDGERYRESLDTSDHRKAKELEKKRISDIQGKATKASRERKDFGALLIKDAVQVYVALRSSHISQRMVQYLIEQARPLAKSKALGRRPLKKITATDIGLYQAERIAQGLAPKTINGEVSVLRQLLKHAKLWYKVSDDYKTIRNTKPPAGRALAEQDLARLIEVASQRLDWRYAHAAIVLSFFCGMRACEIKGLKWKDIHFDSCTLDITRSKTQAGHRSPSLNSICMDVLRDLYDKARMLNARKPEHYVFPWHGREQSIDPTRPMTSWRSAFRSIVKMAGLEGLRFHDGRHTAITVLAEKGQPDWVIQAQVGHVDSKMMKTYSHIRRKALDEAASALEPSFAIKKSSDQSDTLLIG